MGCFCAPLAVPLAWCCVVGIALELVLDGFGKTVRVSAGRWMGIAETSGGAVFNGAGDCVVLRSVDILGELWSLG